MRFYFFQKITQRESLFILREFRQGLVEFVHHYLQMFLLKGESRPEPDGRVTADS